MKIIDVLNLDEAISKLENVKELRFSYALMRNQKIIAQEKSTLLGVLKPVIGYNNFLEEVQVLREQYIEDKQDGEVLIFDKIKYKEGVDPEEFKTKVLELREKYADAIADRKDSIKIYNQFTEDPANIEFYKIKEVHLPADSSYVDLFPLQEIIEFNERDKKSVKLTNYSILSYLQLIPYDLPSIPIRNLLLSNTVILKQKQEDLLKSEEVLEWKKYEAERKALAELHSSKDIYGDVLITTKNEQSEFLIEDKLQFETDMQELNQRYEPVLQKFQDFLSANTTIDLNILNEEELPNDLSLRDIKKLEIFLA